MRTIKFKAKRQDDGQWVTGDLLQHLDGDVLIGDNTGPWTDCGYSHCDYSQLYKVDPTTVCQFTGFTDKNGKEIYEGDVLRSDEFPFSFINEQRKYLDLRFGSIVWDEEKCKFSMLCYTNKKHELTVDKYFEGANYDINQLWCSKFEVVGSIHDKEWQENLNPKDE